MPTRRPFRDRGSPYQVRPVIRRDDHQDGTYAGKPAKFTYTFRGNFHGVAPSGAARAAGTFRETMTFTDSTKETCTSNTQSWTASRNS